ncbi:ATPase [Halobacillus fulvus]|nr:ATPase [Halobacillus fulvus]
MGYVIGIDGGGTKTTCLFLNDQGNSSPDIHKTVSGPGTNPHAIGFDDAVERLEALIRKGLYSYSISPKEIRGIGLGLAGVGREDDKQRLQPLIDQMVSTLDLPENCPLFLGSDSEAALQGALHPDQKTGVLVIAGTGSNAIGRDSNGRVYRCGGWGHLIGDEGSGYYISLKALSSIAKQADGRGPETLLTATILQELKLDDPRQLVSYLHNRPHEKHDIARLAKHVVETAEQKDHVAVHILKEAAEELLLHVHSLFQQASFHASTPVTVAGSLFTHSNIMKQHFIEQLKERQLGIYQNPVGSPELGAALLASPVVTPMKGGDGNE